MADTPAAPGHLHASAGCVLCNTPKLRPHRRFSDGGRGECVGVIAVRIPNGGYRNLCADCVAAAAAAWALAAREIR